MQIRQSNPFTLSTPTGYSHVVEVLSGRTVYIAGQVAFDQSGKLVGKEDFAAQTTQVFENLKLALAAIGATFDNVVKVNTLRHGHVSHPNSPRHPQQILRPERSGKHAGANRQTRT